MTNYPIRKKIVLLVLVFSTYFYSSSTLAQPAIEYATSAEEWHPFRYTEPAEKTSTGIFPDMLKLIFEQELDLQVTYKLRPWKRAQREVKMGSADFLLTIPTKERREYSVVTDYPLFQLYFNLFVYSNHPKLEKIKKIKSIDDIKALDLLLVSTSGNGWYKSNVAKKGIRTEIVKRDKHAAQFVASKRADGMIDVSLSMSPTIEAAGLSDLIELTEVTFGPIDFYIMLSKKSPYTALIAQINQAINKLHNNGEFNQVIDKYGVKSDFNIAK